jgi:FAD/FMN-containing dehydrogenase
MEALIASLAGIVGPQHVLTGDAAAGYAVDWTGRFRGRAAAVVRPRDTGEVAAVLALCSAAGAAVVPQGGNTGLVGGGVPMHGEVLLSLARLTDRSPVDREASQVTAGAGVSLQRVAAAAPDLDLPIQIASRETATVGGAVATNAGGVRVLRYGPMRAQLRGIEAVLSDGTVVSHLAGLTKDNTGYDYPSLLAGSEGTLAVVTSARLRLVPRLRDCVTAVIGVDDLAALHGLARQALASVPGLVSAEFFTSAGLSVLQEHAGMAPPLASAAPAYLLLEAAGPGALDDLADLIGDLPAAVGETAADRRRLWSYRERHPEAAGFLGTPLKLDVSVPAARWVQLASSVAAVVAGADPGARVITFGHVADGNVHVNIVPGGPADGRHEDAVFSFVASLGGSISAEHGIGALKAPWLHLARTSAERGLFARIRGALDPTGTLNPHVLPR